jgi:hypothetical protein
LARKQRKIGENFSQKAGVKRELGEVYPGFLFAAIFLLVICHQIYHHFIGRFFYEKETFVCLVHVAPRFFGLGRLWREKNHIEDGHRRYHRYVLRLLRDCVADPQPKN